MNKFTYALLAASVLAAATPALAADLPSPVAPKAIPAAPITTTIGLEVGPDFVANSNLSTYGQLTDSYISANIGYSFAPNWSIGGSFKNTAKTSGLFSQTATANMSYKFKLTDTFSVTATGTLGAVFGNSGYSNNIPNSTGTDAYLYYQIGGQADFKVTPQWTWNVLNVSYKNAFAFYMSSPSVATGLTYAIDAHNAVYTKVTYGWKDVNNGAGYLPTTTTVAFGYKYGF
jgi:hypothetical protein